MELPDMEWPDQNLFSQSRDTIRANYEASVGWNPGGLPFEALKLGAMDLQQSMPALDQRIVRARVFAYLLGNAQIFIDQSDWFVSKINCRGLLNQVNGSPNDSHHQPQVAQVRAREQQAWSIGAYRASADYAHTVPDWNSIMGLGVPGLLQRVRDARNKASDQTEAQQAFYLSCEIVLQAVLDLLLRFSDKALQAAEMADGQDTQRLRCMAECLKNLASGAPQTLHEAMQLSLLFYVVEIHAEGMNIRSLGGLDRLFDAFYRTDVERGRLNSTQVKALALFYFNHLHLLDVVANVPFYLGGSLADSRCAINALSYLLLDAYCELNSDKIKMHVRVTQDMPQDFMRQICRAIRRGVSSFVMIQDEIALKSLVKAGIGQRYVHEFTPTGCYETTVMGVEVACTECSAINLLKAVDLVIGDGTDLLTGTAFSPACDGQLMSFADFYSAVQKQLSSLIDETLSAVRAFESLYPEFGIFPLFSSTFETCVSAGCDAYAGGCRYSNSGVDVAGLGSAADALCAVQHLVYDTGRLSLDELRLILKNNWSGQEALRSYARTKIPKWGNNDARVDAIAIDLAEFVAQKINGQQNARGGVFKAALYSFDRYIWFGERTAATPDGRKSGDPLSKNLCSAAAMDKNGITAEILSVTKIDYADFPNGSVFDVILHPSAVRGDDGLKAMADLIQIYFRLGGYAVQMNVFDKSTLIDAQRNPEKYATLQVRVCGYSDYFINLDKALQDDFINRIDKGGTE